MVLPSAVGGQYVLTKANSGRGQCPLFRVEKCPLLGGSKCTIYMVRSIGGTGFVRCTEVVRFSEGPLLEVSLYIHANTCKFPVLILICLDMNNVPVIICNNNLL